MKKIILKVFVFILILLILFAILSYIFIPKNNTEEAGREDYGYNAILGEKENSIDMIVLGNSIAYTSIIPMELWKDCGYTSYICGNPGQLLPDSIKVLYDVMQRQNPKIVALEANAIYDDDTSLTIPIARIVQKIFPIAEYHNRWKSLHLNDFYSKIEYTYTDFMKGYYLRKEIAPVDSSNYMAYTDEITEPSKRAKIYVKIMQEYCQQNDSELIILGVPNAELWDYKKHNGLKQFAMDQNIEFIDMNTVWKEIGIDWNNDTLDSGQHLNYFGSLKITKYFEEYLKSRNVLQNHKEDDAFNSWNDDLIKYDEKKI